MEECEPGSDVTGFVPCTLQEYRQRIRGGQDRQTQRPTGNLFHAPDPWALTSAQTPPTMTPNLGRCDLDSWPSSLRAQSQQNHSPWPWCSPFPSSCQPVLKVPACLSAKPTGADATKEEAVLSHLTLSINKAR